MGCDYSITFNFQALDSSSCDGCPVFTQCYSYQEASEPVNSTTSYKCMFLTGARGARQGDDDLPGGPVVFAIPFILLSIILLWVYARRALAKYRSDDQDSEKAWDVYLLSSIWLLLWASLIGSGLAGSWPYCRVDHPINSCRDRLICSNDSPDAGWWWINAIVSALAIILVARLIKYRADGSFFKDEGEFHTGRKRTVIVIIVLFVFFLVHLFWRGTVSGTFALVPLLAALSCLPASYLCCCRSRPVAQGVAGDASNSAV